MFFTVTFEQFIYNVIYMILYFRCSPFVSSAKTSPLRSSSVWVTTCGRLSHCTSAAFAPTSTSVRDGTVLTTVCWGPNTEVCVTLPINNIRKLCVTNALLCAIKLSALIRHLRLLLLEQMGITHLSLWISVVLHKESYLTATSIFSEWMASEITAWRGLVTTTVWEQLKNMANRQENGIHTMRWRKRTEQRTLQ